MNDSVFVLSTTIDKLHRASTYWPVAHTYEDCTTVRWGKGWTTSADKLWFPERFLELGLKLRDKPVSLCGNCEKRRKRYEQSDEAAARGAGLGVRPRETAHA